MMARSNLNIPKHLVEHEILDVKDEVESSVRVYLSGNQSISNSRLTEVEFDTKLYDENNEFDTSTYTFTPAKEGRYLFTAQVGFLSMGSNNVFVISIYSGGVDSRVIASLQVDTSAAGDYYLTLSTTLNVVSGTNFYVSVAQYSGTTKSIEGGVDGCHFCIHKLKEE